MSKRRWPDQTLRQLTEADATLTTARLNALANSAPAADELSLLDGLNAVGNATPSKPLTVDANYQMSGWRRKSVDMDGGNVNAAYAGAIISNLASGSAAMFNLPAALAGMEFYFYVLAAFELRINPDGTETIGLPSSGVQQAGGKYITADAVGEYVHIICAKAGQWETLDYRGTWGVEG